MQLSEPPLPARMVQLIGGFRISQALYVAAALGVPDLLLPGPAPADVLAAQVGAHPPSLRRLLRTLASVGAFTEPEPGVFALTQLGELLTSSQPGSLRNLAISFMETTYEPFAQLMHSVRTGEPAAEHFYGQPYFAWLSDHPAHAARFSAAMADLTGAFKTAAIASLPLDGTRVLVDVGGADGSVLAAILTAHPEVQGVVYDLPRVIAAAPPVLVRAGVQSRVECVSGDFFTSVPSGADTYLVSAVLHDWSDEPAGRILANIAAAGGVGARLLVLDFVMPPGDGPHLSKVSDLNMMAMTGGMERTESEWRALLSAAGYTDIEMHPAGPVFSVIRASVR
jgi:hypothetical protein